MNDFPNLDKLIELALEEDLQDAGDITSESIFSDEQHTFLLISKDTGILCGIGIFEKVMKKTDRLTSVIMKFSDGNRIGKGDLIAEVSGRVTSVLKAERVALNFLSLLSAVATKTSEFVKEANGRVIILDTRKTIPGFRFLQKYAVRCGGGSNHRMGLYDMVMIKDNHIDAAGGISAAVKKVRQKWGNKYKIEVETRNLDEVKEALACGADRIMLDNMGDEETAMAILLTGKTCETEASGNMNLQRIKQVASTGVGFISAGEITSSIRAFDFSLKEKLEKSN
jgi:nicotinate-nucleotide pyrophosphorylase (carboxylating)